MIISSYQSGIITRRANVGMNLSDEEQRELIVWFFNNKPGLLREIVCEECPEH